MVFTSTMEPSPMNHACIKHVSSDFDAYERLIEQLAYARRQLISNDAQRLPITR